MKFLILFFMIISIFITSCEDAKTGTSKKCEEGKIFHPYFDACVVKTCEEGEMINYELNSYCNYGCEESTQNAFIFCSK